MYSVTTNLFCVNIFKFKFYYYFLFFFYLINIDFNATVSVI